MKNYDSFHKQVTDADNFQKQLDNQKQRSEDIKALKKAANKTMQKFIVQYERLAQEAEANRNFGDAEKYREQVKEMKRGKK